MNCCLMTIVLYLDVSMRVKSAVRYFFINAVALNNEQKYYKL